MTTDSRQYLSSRLEKLDKTRMAGFVLTRQGAVGKWGAATYALLQSAGQEHHRGHRGDNTDELPRTRPYKAVGANINAAVTDYGPKTPMPPMASVTVQKSAVAEMDRPLGRKRVAVCMGGLGMRATHQGKSMTLIPSKSPPYWTTGTKKHARYAVLFSTGMSRA